MSVLATSVWHVLHHFFWLMRERHSRCSWLKLMVAAASVAGNTRIGMFTRLILRYPFHVGRAAIWTPSNLVIIGRSVVRSQCNEPGHWRYTEPWLVCSRLCSPVPWVPCCWWGTLVSPSRVRALRAAP